MVRETSTTPLKMILNVQRLSPLLGKVLIVDAKK